MSIKKVSLIELKALIESYMLTHKNKLKIKQIARMIGIKPEKLSAYLNKGVKTQETIDRVCEFLNVRLDEKIITAKPTIVFTGKNAETPSGKGGAEITERRRRIEEHEERKKLKEEFDYDPSK